MFPTNTGAATGCGSGVQPHCWIGCGHRRGGDRPTYGVPSMIRKHPFATAPHSGLSWARCWTMPTASMKLSPTTPGPIHRYYRCALLPASGTKVMSLRVGSMNRSPQFTPKFFAHSRDWGESSELPVFVVGMPRSGTSLVEQIAASHPEVFGAGERRDMGNIAASLRF